MGIKEQTNRNKVKHRKTKCAWLIICEGRNRTETNYLHHFSKRDGSVCLVIKPSENTDPKGMVLRAEKLAKDLDIGKNAGDRIICLIDLDISTEKAQTIDHLRRNHQKVEIIITNPCFEIWFLLHFTSHPDRESCSHNVKKQLARYIPNYTENMDVMQKSKEVQYNYEIAIQNAEILRAEHIRKNLSILSPDANPYTEMDILIKRLLSENGKPQIDNN